MKIAIVGAGASGIFLAIRLKEECPSLSIAIFERNDDILKKMLVTGNGRCNYASIASTSNKYHNDQFANRLLKKFTPQNIIDTFESFGVHAHLIDQSIFPISNSASSVVNILKNKIKQLGIDIYLQTKIIDYQNIGKQYVLLTHDNQYVFDQVVFAAGGHCYPQLGTDGSILQILEKHGYKIEHLSPSLSPIKVKENTKKIAGQKARCLVSLFDHERLIHQESGEVLFKDDGLSGIVILNMSQKINMIQNKNSIKIVLDLAPHVGFIEKENYIEYVTPKIADYLNIHQLDIHCLSFSFKNFYDVKIAEVSHGGVSLDEIDEYLCSKKEPGIYFIGEILDVDGMCGGFNLMFAFASAEQVKKGISSALN